MKKCFPNVPTSWRHAKIFELQISGPLNEYNIVAINYLKSSSTKDWYQNWNGDWLSRKNSTFPSSKYSSYPFEETYLEFSGYSSSGDIFYKTGIDFQKKVFNVLTNGPEFQSFEVSKSQTFPFLLSFKTNSQWSSIENLS